MDALSEMLKAIRFNGAAFVEAELKAPWSFLIPAQRTIAEALMPEAAHIASCHVVTEGGCSVRLGQDQIIEVAAGEVVVFPRGDQHVLCRTLERAPESLTARDVSKFFSREKVKPLRCGGGGDATAIVSGFFACEPRLSAPMLAALPPVMRVNLNDNPEMRWLQSAVRFSAAESAQPRAGGVTMLTNLSELLFAEAFRR